MQHATPSALPLSTRRNIVKCFFDLKGTTASENCPLQASSTAGEEGDRLGKGPLYPLCTSSRDSEWGLAASSSCWKDERTETTVPYKAGHLNQLEKGEAVDPNQLLQAPLLGNMPPLMFQLTHASMPTGGLQLTLYLHPHHKKPGLLLVAPAPQHPQVLCKEEGLLPHKTGPQGLVFELEKLDKHSNITSLLIFRRGEVPCQSCSSTSKS